MSATQCSVAGASNACEESLKAQSLTLPLPASQQVGDGIASPTSKKAYHVRWPYITHSLPPSPTLPRSQRAPSPSSSGAAPAAVSSASSPMGSGRTGARKATMGVASGPALAKAGLRNDGARESSPCAVRTPRASENVQRVAGSTTPRIGGSTTPRAAGGAAPRAVGNITPRAAGAAADMYTAVKRLFDPTPRAAANTTRGAGSPTRAAILQERRVGFRSPSPSSPSSRAASSRSGAVAGSVRQQSIRGAATGYAAKANNPTAQQLSARRQDVSSRSGQKARGMGQATPRSSGLSGPSYSERRKSLSLALHMKAPEDKSSQSSQEQPEEEPATPKGKGKGSGKGPPPPPQPKGEGKGKPAKAAAKKPASNGKTKPLAWNMLDDFDGDGDTFWAKFRSAADDVMLTREALEKVFGYHSAGKVATTGHEESDEHKKVCLTSGVRSMGISIGIHNLRHLGFAGVKEAILSLDSSTLTLDATDRLLARDAKTQETVVLPSAEEVAAVATHLATGTTPHEHLDEASQFMVAVHGIPHLQARLEFHQLRLSFGNAAKAMREPLRVLDKALEQVQHCEKLAAVLMLVLKAGNVLNDGTAHGDAKAFRMDSLQKLALVKGQDPESDGKCAESSQYNLLDYLVDIISTQRPELLEVASELEELAVAGRTELPEVERGVNQFRSDIQRLEKILCPPKAVHQIDAVKAEEGNGETDCIKQPESDMEKETSPQETEDLGLAGASEYFAKCIDDIAEIDAEVEKVQGRYKQVMVFFGEKCQQKDAHPLHQWLGYIHTFVMDLSKAATAQKQKKEKEKAKQERFQKRRRRASTSCGASRRASKSISSPSRRGSKSRASIRALSVDFCDRAVSESPNLFARRSSVRKTKSIPSRSTRKRSSCHLLNSALKSQLQALRDRLENAAPENSDGDSDSDDSDCTPAAPPAAQTAAPAPTPVETPAETPAATPAATPVTAIVSRPNASPTPASSSSAFCWGSDQYAATSGGGYMDLVSSATGTANSALARDDTDFDNPVPHKRKEKRSISWGGHTEAFVSMQDGDEDEVLAAEPVAVAPVAAAPVVTLSLLDFE